jgi:hypothetical protein
MTDVWDKSQGGRQKTPENSIWHADQKQPKAHCDPEAAIDVRLHEQLAADALAGLIHRFGSQRHLAVVGVPSMTHAWCTLGRLGG